MSYCLLEISWSVTNTDVYNFKLRCIEELS